MQIILKCVNERSNERSHESYEGCESYNQVQGVQGFRQLPPNSSLHVYFSDNPALPALNLLYYPSI